MKLGQASWLSRRGILVRSGVASGLLLVALKDTSSADVVPSTTSPSVSASPLAGRLSIDSNIDNDNGYLANARNHNPNAGQHKDTAEAAHNISSGDKAKILIGHGDEGIIVTGTGQVQEDSARYIANGNLSEWRSYIQSLRGVCDRIRLWACHTGAGQEGANLIFSIAQLANCPVEASSGFVYDDDSGGFWLESGAQWVVATPTAKPSPVSPPSQSGALRFGVMRVATGQGMLDITSDNVSSISVLAVQGRAGGTASGGASTVRGDEAKVLFRQIGVSEPFKLSGVPGALITGKIQIALKDGTKETLLILNNRLLQSIEHPEVFYYCSPNIRALLEKFSK